MAKPTVVVVDDDMEFLEELKEVLCASGYAVEVVSDPLAVVPLIERAKPDAVLLDLKMDQKDGFEIAGELSRNAATSKVPVIAMTGHYAEEQIVRLSSSGVVKSFLTKPLSISDVMAVLDEVRGRDEPGKE